MRFFTTFLLLLISYSFLFSQKYVNKQWEISNGVPDNINWSASVLDHQNHLVTTGNTLADNQKANILTVKYDEDGNIIWQQEYNHFTNDQDYGTAITVDENDNIYVTGAAFIPIENAYDMVVLKYSPSGALLWSTHYNGESALNDAPSAVSLDGNGHLYVVGGTENEGSNFDYCIIKYTTDGQQLWVKQYDYNNLYDIPVGVEIDGAQNVVITGGSSASTVTWDYATVKLSPEGLLLGEHRLEAEGAGINQPNALAKDAEGNIYVVGKFTNAAGNYDIKVIKLDPQLQLDWSVTFDGEGLDDTANSLVIDDDGNCYITGSVRRSSGAEDLIVIKYNSQGQQEWLRTRQGITVNQKVTGKKVTLQDDNPLIVGEIKSGSEKQILVIEYDKHTGSVVWEEIYEGEYSDNSAGNIHASNQGDVYVTGKSSDGNEETYTTVKYATFQQQNDVIYAGDSPSHRANEVIVKFVPAFVNTSFVNNANQRFGKIQDVLSADIVAVLNANTTVNLERANVVKIFPRLSTAHQHSITRLGRTTPIPEFWSSFLLSFSTETDIDLLIDELNQNSEYIHFAEPNHVYQLFTIPDDDYFQSGEQAALEPTNEFPDADMNVNPAWDIETGKSFTKVGVYDSEIFWGHEGFGDGTFGGSQVVGGWDFVDNMPISSITSPTNSHGTAVSGIIGALRDNNLGVAGIAGGGEDENGQTNAGVSLFSIAVNDGVEGFLNSSNIAPAIVEGAMDDPNANPPGYGLHIMNHSWGGDSFNQLLYNSFGFAFENEVINIISKGNLNTDDLTYPADYKEEWIISIGASGTDGNVKRGNNGDPYFSAAYGEDWSSNFGNNMDVIAPGVTELVATLISPSAPFTAIPDGSTTDFFPDVSDVAPNYQPFGGTSAAAPNVAGVAALMYSNYNTENGRDNNLAPEDVEHLLENFAIDIVGTAANYPEGYDVRNGWGRVNAGETLKHLKAPDCTVYHSGEPDNRNTTFAAGITVHVSSQASSLPAGNYVADRVQITDTYLDIFPPNADILGQWGRLSSTIGVSAINPVSGESSADYDFVVEENVVSVTVTTHAWHILNSINGQNVDIWIPAPPDELSTAYSVHYCNNSTTSVNNEPLEGVIKLLPNPANDFITLTYETDETIAAQLVITDIHGKLILSRKEILSPNSITQLDISNFTSGVYLCQIITNNGTHSDRFIKQ